MSNLFDDDDFGFEEEPEYKGIRFCPECKQMLHPKDSNGKLGFECQVAGCAYETIIDDTQSRYENLVSRREFAKEDKKMLNYNEFSADPTMPREDRECPKCNKRGAVFFIESDTEDTKIIVVYICCNTGCGHYWNKTD